MRNAALDRAWEDAVRFPGDTIVAIGTRRPWLTWGAAFGSCFAIARVGEFTTEIRFLLPAALGAAAGGIVRDAARKRFLILAGLGFAVCGFVSLDRSGAFGALLMTLGWSARLSAGWFVSELLLPLTGSALLTFLVFLPGRFRRARVAALVASLFLFGGGFRHVAFIAAATAVLSMAPARWIRMGLLLSTPVILGLVAVVVLKTVPGFKVEHIAPLPACSVVIGTAAAIVRCSTAGGASRRSADAAVLVWQWEPWLGVPAVFFGLSCTLWIWVGTMNCATSISDAAGALLYFPAWAFAVLAAITSAHLVANARSMAARAAPVAAVLVPTGVLFALASGSSTGDLDEITVIFGGSMVLMLAGTWIAWRPEPVISPRLRGFAVAACIVVVAASPAVLAETLDGQGGGFDRSAIAFPYWALVLAVAHRALVVDRRGVWFPVAAMAGTGVLTAVVFNVLRWESDAVAWATTLWLGLMFAAVGLLAVVARKGLDVTAVPLDHPIHTDFAGLPDPGARGSDPDTAARAAGPVA